MGEIFAGRYELIDPIGRGGVGAVWRAWDHRRRRYVATKVLQQSDAHTLLRFVREQAMRIDHPHVLAPASWAANDDKVLFTMDLVNGGSLAHLIGDYGPLPPRYVCILLDQLLAGLTAVHAEGVVHRDIKPANVLLEATGTGRPHLRLSDFGIAMRKGEPRLTEANYVVGTPGYFAPEQMLGAEPDFPADLFAVGLVALYLVTGNKPDTEALVRLFEEHGIPNAPEDVPEPLWQVLASLLHPDPESRFKTATGARKALVAAAEMLPDDPLDEETVEVFDHIGPLPKGYGPNGPLTAGQPPAGPSAAAGTAGTAPPVSLSETGSFQLAPPERSAPVPGQPSAPPTPPPAPTPGSTPPDQGLPPAPAAPPSTPAAPMPAYHPTAPVQRNSGGTRPYTAGPHPVPGQPPVDASGQAGQPGPPTPMTPVTPVTPVTPMAAAPATPPTAVPSAAPAIVPHRKPGPPPKVAVPVLIVALLCIAVGVWALTAA
ncbi:serine/threonine-protein kinase [Streptomyces halobius]|uniref:non-specific serine/threonine protein kinase n=1 Tax=Streptomyces halobius TaxID=2879846 RepID=A0ABY4MA62_9ACTN|nr:serine/threonine-protein kinase [Streptomyces halobius]UQA94293.1 serine/threonine protein kinase [Streptomyces halobius]